MFLLVTLPNIHQFFFHPRTQQWTFLNLVINNATATLPCNLSLRACFADINVSQNSVATYARCGGIFNKLIHLTANLHRNLPVNNFFKSVNIWQNYGHESVAPFFGPSCMSAVVSEKSRGNKKCDEEEEEEERHIFGFFGIAVKWPWHGCMQLFIHVHSVKDNTMMSIFDRFHFSFVLLGLPKISPNRYT